VCALCMCMLGVYDVFAMASTCRCNSAEFSGCFCSSLGAHSATACGGGRVAGECELKDGDSNGW